MNAPILKLDAPAAPVSEINHRPDDDELASELANRWRGKVAYFRGAWHTYSAGLWTERTAQEQEKAIRGFLTEYRKYGLKVSFQQVRSVARMIESDLIVTDSALNAAEGAGENFVNLQNGLYNLTTHKLEPHRAELYFTSQLGFAYDANALCPAWGKYLTSTLVTGDGKPDGAMKMMLMEAMAYSLTARTDLKASFWVVGKPDSGKSTLITLLRNLAGSLQGTIDLNRIGDNRFMLSGVAGKRVVTFTEADSSAVLPDALYKAIVGAKDEIWVEAKGKQGYAMVPRFKIWWAMNETPRISDRSGATINRLKPILFNRTIPARERINDLDEMLKAELPGIFRQAMIAYKRLQKAGRFTAVPQAEGWLTNYRMENDTEASFVQERCLVDHQFSIQSDELYQEYRAWAEANGFRTKNRNQIAKDWERLGMVKSMTNGRVLWRGLKLREIYTRGAK